MMGLLDRWLNRDECRCGRPLGAVPYRDLMDRHFRQGDRLREAMDEKERWELVAKFLLHNCDDEGVRTLAQSIIDRRKP